LKKTISLQNQKRETIMSKMDKISCITEKYSSRAIGLIILPLALALGFLGFLILPVVGLIFSVPLFILAFAFIAAPESKVCRLILRKDSNEG
jgi:hypothetical protein